MEDYWLTHAEWILYIPDDKFSASLNLFSAINSLHADLIC